MNKSIWLAPVLLATLAANPVFAHGDEGEEHDMGSMPGMGAMHESMHHHDVGGGNVGQPVATDKATRTIHVALLDTMRMQFSESANLHNGDVIEFVVTNKGKMEHEFSIADAEEQTEHQAMMRRMPNMKHSDGNTLTVEPGQTQVLTWQFKGDEEVVFACNLPGHFEAGMFVKAKIQSGK